MLLVQSGWLPVASNNTGIGRVACGTVTVTSPPSFKSDFFQCHTAHGRAVSVTGNPRLMLTLYLAENFAGKRRYDRKQSGFGGQTKPVFRKKVLISAPP